ncbi:hypothetical protein LTR64_005720 [Lithohypha guttulata]|uniref:uncharacterized protein n=1 Tax=Lithohypha guttulata TaxID=1690604 RepID=UPI002DE0664F|nr:hypothetical protein LTR51_002485 [Lithohypha guttulata]
MSELARPNAFLHHRDTLDRLWTSADEEEQDNEEILCQELFFHRPQLFNHRDTLARLHFKQNSGSALPDHVLCQIAKLLDPDSYKNMRLVCRQWSDNLPRPVLSSAQRLPPEIVVQILNYLALVDFDSARHTCRVWFLPSLDHKIATSVLKASGNQSAHLHDLQCARQRRRQSSSQLETSNLELGNTVPEHIDQEWLMSKRLATESRLSGYWRGSSIRRDSGHTLSSFSITEEVDFSRLLHQACSSTSTDLVLRRFTISACGSYLMVIVDEEIFVYNLRTPEASICPVVRIVAGRRVLAISMDVSSGRNSIATLLDGRVGASWDLNNLPVGDAISTQVGEPLDLGMRTHIQGLAPLGVAKPVPMEGLSDTARGADGPAFHSIISDEEVVESTYGLVPCQTESPEAASPWLSQEYRRNSDLQALLNVSEPSLGPIKIIARPTSVYANLGTGSDSPRSVAICPQRKCVAFGCRGGIELHWVDKTTGTSLNRWFPLAAPSDHLYFLPQRPGSDSTKKLRLISSAADPLQSRPARRASAPTKWKLRSSYPGHGRLQSMTRLFFGSLPFPSALSRSNSTLQEDNERQGILRTVDCDHYLAVPLSDGVNVLFTCPASGLLCLGSDAPLGGPTKLMRKVCMVPPASDTPEKASALTCYRAGHDLRWGVRIVAAYDDGRVILYNIPLDCFNRIRHIRSTPDVWDELAGVVGQSDLLMDIFMAEQHDVSEPDSKGEGLALTRQSSDSSSSSRSFRSLQMDGTVIFHAKSGVNDLQVDCAGGGVRVWIFMRDSTAVRLSIYTLRNFQPVHKYVNVDGLVHDLGQYHAIQKEDDCPVAKIKGKGKGKVHMELPSDDEPSIEEEQEGHVKFVVF